MEVLEALIMPSSIRYARYYRFHNISALEYIHRLFSMEESHHNSNRVGSGVSGKSGDGRRSGQHTEAKYASFAVEDMGRYLAACNWRWLGRVYPRGSILNFGSRPGNAGGSNSNLNRMAPFTAGGSSANQATCHYRSLCGCTSNAVVRCVPLRHGDSSPLHVLAVRHFLYFRAATRWRQRPNGHNYRCGHSVPLRERHRFCYRVRLPLSATWGIVRSGVGRNAGIFHGLTLSVLAEFESSG